MDLHLWRPLVPLLFNCYIKAKVRKVIAEREVSAERARDFIRSNEKAYVEDIDGREYSLADLLNLKEEEQNAESVGSDDRIGQDYSIGSFGTFSEDTDRELS